MNDYKRLIADLTAAANRNSNSLNTRDTCRKAADAIERLIKERDELLQERTKRELCINNHVPTVRELARAYDELYY